MNLAKRFAKARAEGYRSGLEVKVAAELKIMGVDVGYEVVTNKYNVPRRNYSYTFDFVLPNGIAIEAKGRFLTADRTKHRLIREQYPDVDIRFVFSNPNETIGKKSKTTYALWCERLGIPFAHRSVPVEWVNEPFSKKRWAALKKIVTKPLS